jgi:translocation and assembly module TamB
VDVASDGQITVNGPVLKTDQIRGSVRLTRLQADLSMRKAGASGDTVVIQNQDPVSVTLDKGTFRIESAHFTGKQTDIRAIGTVSLQKQTLDLTLNANANLALLQNINRDFYSSGDIVLASTVHGTISQPLVNGQLELKNATVNYANLPNGISNANGLVMFNGNSASIRNLTAESGGGKLTVAGFASFRQGLRFGLRGTAENVRVKVQQGVSVVADANLNVAGTMENSQATGTITITQVNYTPKSDFGSILTRAAPPVQAPSAPSPILEGMKLDINVRTSSAMLVQASLAQNLQANADLRIRGTAAQPGAVGRVNISEGQLTFFGATYTVNSGTISFFNPLRIEPILDISLETQVRGINVTLTVAGPIDNMKLSYTSDPPLQFQEIISLLASGRTPTSDPNILATQPSQPAQSFQGMGESALIGKALADPVAGQLQRVFGVSQLLIDPTFTSGWEVPQARLTLQQRISNNVTFTYVTALNSSNTQIIQAEWAMSPRWSALATRDQNGIVNINLFYKKQLR